MGRMYHRPSGAHSDQKAWLATPSYSGVMAGYAWSLSSSMIALHEAGIVAETAIFDGDCHVDDARNRLVRDFLESDCTDLVFLDADMRWEPKDLVKILKHDRDVVGATYPFKQLEDAFPVQFMEGENWADGDGLIEVGGLPTGFLRIRRNALEQLAAKAPHFMPKSDMRSPIPLIFERTLSEKKRVGGDYAFCEKWRAQGGKIYVDPEIDLEHSGERQWNGSLGHFKRVELYGAIKAGVMEIRNGIEKPKTFEDMVEEWGNGFGVTGDFLAVAVTMARGVDGPIFEAGSGISTISMAATGADLVSIEQDKKCVERLNEYGVVVQHIPMNGGWYDLHSDFPKKFDLAVIDGPSRHTGDRKLFLKSGITADYYLIDDLETPGYMEMAKILGDVVHVGTHREFGIVRGNGKPWPQPTT